LSVADTVKVVALQELGDGVTITIGLAEIVSPDTEIINVLVTVALLLFTSLICTDP
jgi:hypothetical protein